MKQTCLSKKCLCLGGRDLYQPKQLKRDIGQYTVVYLFYENFFVDSIKTFLNDKADNTEAAMGLVYKINRDFKNRHPVYPL